MARQRRTHGEGSAFTRQDGRIVAQITLPDGSKKQFYRDVFDLPFHTERMALDFLVWFRVESRLNRNHPDVQVRLREILGVSNEGEGEI